MKEIELRKYCLDKAVEILGWYKQFLWTHNLDAIRLSDIIYRYLTTGIVESMGLPHGSRQCHRDVETQ